MNEQIESLLDEKNAIVEDLVKFGADLKGHTYDTLINRVEMIDYMLSDEGYYNRR